MAQNINAIKGTVRAKGEDVLVSDMHFGDQLTKGGIIIGNDDGKTRGVYPRWGKVFSKGPDNKDDFEVGDWQQGFTTVKLPRDTLFDFTYSWTLDKIEHSATIKNMSCAPDSL